VIATRQDPDAAREGPGEKVREALACLRLDSAEPTV